MKTIQIQIDCDDKYCLKCSFLDRKHLFCDQFSRVLKMEGVEVIRCRQCLSAEVKEQDNEI